MESAENHKSGFIAVMGRPNVGKSTLLNRLLSQKVAAVSPKPQTTRLQQLGILTIPEAQLIFIDTPGLHHPQNKLGEYMNHDAILALEEADIALVILDGSFPPSAEDQLFSSSFQQLKEKPSVVLALNKIDKLSPDQTNERDALYQNLFPDGEITFCIFMGRIS